MRVPAVFAACFAVLAAGLVLVLLESKPRQAGSNYVPESGPTVTIKGSGAHCQEPSVVPEEAAGLRLLIGTFGPPTPELGVTVESGGRAVSSGSLPAGLPQGGHVVVPIEEVDELQPDARVCVRVVGAGERRRTVLYGTLGTVRFEWVKGDSENWLALAPGVVDRLGLGKPFVSGSWAFILAIVLLAFAWVFALRVAIRELDR